MDWVLLPNVTLSFVQLYVYGAMPPEGLAVRLMPEPAQIAPVGAPVIVTETPAQLIATVYDWLPVQPDAVCVAWTVKL